MGHAIHFLSRLERVEDEVQLELAKSLYRDTALLAHILQRARLPDAVDRVALSLADPGGPYLVVTRDGGFVTCLGEGMSTRDLPIVSKAKLDHLAAENALLRERMALARKLVGEGNENKLLFRRLRRARGVTREEFLALTALAPIYQRALPALMLKAGRVLSENRALFIRVTSKPLRRLSSLEKEIVLATWRAMWEVGHHALLIASIDRDEREAVWSSLATSEDVERRMRLFCPALRLGPLGITLRGALAIVSCGKACLATAKRQLALGDERYLDAALALVALAAGHRPLQAEIVKTFNPPKVFEPSLPLRARFASFFAAALAGELDEYGQVVTLACRTAFRKYLAPAVAPRTFATDEEVPDDLALPLLTSSPVNLFERDGLWKIVSFIHHLARVKPEDLYPPTSSADDPSSLDELDLPDAYEAVRLLATPADQEPVREEPRPTPNAPCSCGSGQKYKRCCGGR